MPAGERRWDSDERGTGVRDASAFAEPVDRLLATLVLPGWIAEEPDAHLLPHIEKAITELGVRLVRWQDVDGVLEIEVALGEAPRKAGAVVAHTLVAAIAEASTHVREIARGTFEVITGMLPGDGAFATHGHVLRIYTTGRDPAPGA